MMAPATIKLAKVRLTGEKKFTSLILIQIFFLALEKEIINLFTMLQAMFILYSILKKTHMKKIILPTIIKPMLRKINNN